MNLKKIIISGSVFSGKQTALHILDNNQNILINLIHDKMINSLRYLYSLENAKVNNLKNKLIIFEKGKKKVELSQDNLNYSLENTSFNKSLKKYANEGKIPNKFSNKIEEYYDFNFNFERFKKNFFYDILNTKIKKEIFTEEFIDLFLLNFFKEKENKDFSQLKNKTYVFKAPNDQDSINFVLNENFNCKIIYVGRDISGLIKSRAQSYILNHQSDQTLNIDSVYNWMINSNFVDKIRFERNKIKSTQKIFNNKIFITTLEKLVYDTQNEQNNIYKFLNLANCSSTYQNSKHLNKVNDDEIVIEKNNEIFLYYRYYGLRHILNNFQINIFLRYIFFNIKKLILKIVN